MLKGTSTLYKHPKAATLYLTIPADMAKDSQFGWQGGDEVEFNYDPATKELVVRKREKTK